MKTLVNTLTLLLLLMPAFSSLSQGTTPDTTDVILSTDLGDTIQFEVTPLTPSRRGAYFSY